MPLDLHQQLLMPWVDGSCCRRMAASSPGLRREMTMYPILFYFGPYPVFTYGVCISLGLIILFGVAFVLARRAGWRWDQLLPLSLGVLVGGYVGARLSHMLVEPEKILDLLDFYSLFQPGTPGNIVGLFVGGYLGGLAVQKRLALPSLGNYCAPGVASASICWRIGCTCGGCCYGTETNLPWAIALDGAPRHPTMIYEGLFNLVMLVVLIRWRHRFTGANDLLALYLGSYAVFRFGLEFIRLYPPIVLGLTGIHLLCLGIVSWLAVRLWRAQIGQRRPAGAA
jgi:phosphatidylglycerol:prolipoprotein diacylglycerol transferase